MGQHYAPPTLARSPFPKDLLRIERVARRRELGQRRDDGEVVGRRVGRERVEERPAADLADDREVEGRPVELREAGRVDDVVDERERGHAAHDRRE